MELTVDHFELRRVPCIGNHLLHHEARRGTLAQFGEMVSIVGVSGYGGGFLTLIEVVRT